MRIDFIIPVRTYAYTQAHTAPIWLTRAHKPSLGYEPMYSFPQWNVKIIWFSRVAICILVFLYINIVFLPSPLFQTPLPDSEQNANIKSGQNTNTVYWHILKCAYVRLARSTTLQRRARQLVRRYILVAACRPHNSSPLGSPLPAVGRLHLKQT